MLFVANSNLVALLLGLLIGLVVAFWVYKMRRSKTPTAADDQPKSIEPESPLP